jgi:hypothetical protein
MRKRILIFTAVVAVKMRNKRSGFRNTETRSKEGFDNPRKEAECPE